MKQYFNVLIFLLALLVFLWGLVHKAGAGDRMCYKNSTLVIQKLIQCESNGNANAINHDDGGSASFGILQFKEDTFWRYNQKYRLLPNLERSEVMNVIMTPEIQVKLAKAVISDGGIGNWRNCSEKLNLGRLNAK